MRYNKEDHINDWNTGDMLFTDPLYSKVRCNMCEFEGYEYNLIIANDEGEYIKACPNCKTDWYLMDIQ